MRRITIINFTQSFVDHPRKANERLRDTQLQDRLMKNLPAIFNWCLEGYLILRRTREFTTMEDEEKAKQEFMEASNPLITQTADNSAEVVLSGEKVYWKDYYVESTPQTAVNLGLSMRTPNNIFVNVDCNYYDAMYLSMNPLYRTDMALTGRVFDSNTPEENLAAVKEMTAQERFDHAFVLNASIGKNWYISNRRYNLGFSLEVKNILNNQNIKTGGYEQMRLSKDESGTTVKYNRFDSRYFYMLGTTYYMNLYFRF